MKTRVFAYFAFEALSASAAAAQLFLVRAEVRSHDAEGLGFVAAHESALPTCFHTRF